MGLLVEFAKEPAGELALLFILPDASDIAQAIFDPRQGRRRKPARRGRKRPKPRGLPDPSDIIGNKISASADPYGGLKVGPQKYFFPILNVYEGLTFGLAIVEGLTDIGFEAFLGALTVDASQCKQIARCMRTYGQGGFDIVGNATESLLPIPVVQQQIGMASTWGSMSYTGHDFEVTVGFTATGHWTGGNAQGRIVLRPIGLGYEVLSNRVSLAYGSSEEVSVGASFPSGTNVQWFWRSDGGAVKMTDGLAVGYSLGQIHW